MSINYMKKCSMLPAKEMKGTVIFTVLYSGIPFHISEKLEATKFSTSDNPEPKILSSSVQQNFLK